MGCHQADAAEQAAWRSSGERPTCPQWHFLGLAIRSTLACSTGGIRSLRHLLQPLCSLAAGWCLGAAWIDALAAAHDAAVQMIDTSIVRVHQHGACITRNQRQSMGRSRGGLTSKIHAVVDSNGLPVRLALSSGEAHDVRLAGKLLSRLKSGSMLLADRGVINCLIQDGIDQNVGKSRPARVIFADFVTIALGRVSFL